MSSRVLTLFTMICAASVVIPTGLKLVAKLCLERVRERSHRALSRAAGREAHGH
jgi:hypothetical protein